MHCWLPHAVAQLCYSSKQVTAAQAGLGAHQLPSDLPKQHQVVNVQYAEVVVELLLHSAQALILSCYVLDNRGGGLETFNSPTCMCMSCKA